jgi:hypothetical protein
MKRLRVLISSHEFSPEQGSECAVGWNIATRMAAYHDVTAGQLAPGWSCGCLNSECKVLLAHEEPASSQGMGITDEGLMDRTHLRFFTINSIRRMFECCGYKIMTLEGVTTCKLSLKFRLLNMLFLNCLDDMRMAQFACVAQKI